MALSIITLNTTDNGVTSRNTINSNFANILASYPTSAILVGTTDVQTLTNKILTSATLTTPTVNVGSDATGDVYYRNAGVLTRLGIGTVGQFLGVGAGVPAWASLSGLNTNYIVDTGVANAYVATLVPALTSYGTGGQLVQFKATNANTTASTLNVNGLGVKSIFKGNGTTALAVGDIAAGMIVELEYDGTNFVMLNPVANTVSLTSGVYPVGSAANLTSIPLPAMVSLVVNVASSVTTTTVTHNLGVIPRYAYFRSTAVRGTGTAVSTGMCNWNNSTGVVIRQNTVGNNYDTNGAVISFPESQSGIYFTQGSSFVQYGAAGTTTSTSFTITHALNTGSTFDIYIELYA